MTDTDLAAAFVAFGDGGCVRGPFPHNRYSSTAPVTNEDTVPSSGTAMRFNDKKSEMSYILHYPHAIEALVQVLHQGAVKYDHLNWKKGGKPDEEYLDACQRHLFKHVNEGVYDEDIGTVHIANAIWNLMTLIECNMQDHEVLDPDFDQEAFEEKYR